MQSLNAAHDQKTSYAQKKIVHTAILLTFAFRSKHSWKNSGSNSKRQNFTNKTVIAAEATTFCIKPLTHYLSSSALKIGET